jgi:hypothetical protein
MSGQNVTYAWQSNLLDFRLPSLCTWDLRSSGTAWPLQMGQIGYPDASVNRRQNTLRNVAEERRPHRLILWKRNLWVCEPWNPLLLKIYCMCNYWSRHKNLQGLEWTFRFHRRRDFPWLILCSPVRASSINFKNIPTRWHFFVQYFYSLQTALHVPG